MTLLGRTLRYVLAAALMLAAGVIGTPATAVASAGQISVGASDADGLELQVTALPGFAGLLADEFLEVEDLGILIYVRVKSDTTQDGAGRDLFTASPPCYSTGVATVLCTRSRNFLQVRADMTATSGYVQWVMLEDLINRTPLVYKGGSGVDEVYASKGDDYILGGDGADILFGGAGDDFLSGGPGNDKIEGESGRDDMRGDTGSNSLDAADGIADVRVDCGGVPLFLDFDEGKDSPTNCGEQPTPIPPAPVEPVDPPTPGQGNGTVDGVPTAVEVAPAGGDNRSVTITAPANNIFMNMGLWLGAPSNPTAPTFPPLSNSWSFQMPGLFPSSILDLSIWSAPPVGPTSGAPARTVPRSQPISTTAIKVNAQGVAEGSAPVPGGQKPGSFIVQVNAVTASGAAATINVGVVLTETTPDPDPGPDETIGIASATRGKGKKAPTITISGTTTGLAGASITPRYRVQGAKSWTTGKAVAVTDAGTFTWRLITPKKVRIVMVSGAIKSKPVQVAAVKK